MLTSAMVDMVNIPISNMLIVSPSPFTYIPTCTDISEEAMNQLLQLTELDKEQERELNYTSLLLVSLYYILFYTTSLSLSKCVRFSI